MGKEIRNTDIKVSNKVKIARFILHQGETSKAEIASALNLSMPTVLQNIKLLMDEHIITEIGEYQSTGGRKAKALAISANEKYAVGIDITANHINYVLVNLKGELVAHKRIRMVFEASLSYNQSLNLNLSRFLAETEVDLELLLGVGISLPGIIDKESPALIQSHILKIQNYSLKHLTQIIPYPVYFENDANSAAMAEFRYLDKNAIYLSLSRTVGGAIYMNQETYEGENYRSAEFGHMIIEPRGKTCYCGKEGCLDAYCSAAVLDQHADENLESFFQKLKQGDPALELIWENYLDYLGIAVTNLRMAFDCDIMLGGDVGGYLENHMPALTQSLMKYNQFENDTVYLKVCHYKKNAAAIGIAMAFVEKYFDTLS